MKRSDFLQKAGLGLLAFSSPALANATSQQPTLPGKANLDDSYWKALRQQFPLGTKPLYLNNGTMGPSPYYVIDAVHKAMAEADEKGAYGGWEAAAAKLATFLHVKDTEIALTHNVTEGINIVACGLPLKKGDEVILTTHEHVGNALPWLNRARLQGIKIKTITPAPTAAETLQRVNDAITKKTKAIALPHIPCTIGQIFPVKEICALARSKGIWSFIDGAHGPGMLSLDLADMGCDFYASCCHKWMLGPKGTGFLYVRKDMQDLLQTQMVGGGSDKGWDMLAAEPNMTGYAESAHRYYYGTQNYALYKGVIASIEFIEAIGISAIETRIRGLAAKMQQEILNLGNIDMMTPVEDISRGAVIGFRVKGKDNEQIYKDAAEANIRIRYVAENKLNNLRVSTHIYNSEEDIATFIAFLKTKM